MNTNQVTLDLLPKVIPDRVRVMVKVDSDYSVSYQTSFNIALTSTLGSLKSKVRTVFSIFGDFSFYSLSSLLLTEDSTFTELYSLLQLSHNQTLFVTVKKSNSPILFRVHIEDQQDSAYTIRTSTTATVSQLKEKVRETFAIPSKVDFDLITEDYLSLEDETAIVGEVCKKDRENICWLTVELQQPIQILWSSRPVPTLVLPPNLKPLIAPTPSTSPVDHSLLFPSPVPVSSPTLMEKIFSHVKSEMNEVEENLDRIFTSPVPPVKSEVVPWSFVANDTKTQELLEYIEKFSSGKNSWNEHPDLSIITNLIRLGADPNTKCQDLYSNALLVYMLNNQGTLECVGQVLSDLEFLLRVTDRCELCEGETPLHIAIAIGSIPLIKAVLVTGKYNYLLDSILTYALTDDDTNEIIKRYSCSWETFKCLVDAGANLFAVSEDDGESTLLDLVDNSWDVTHSKRIRDYLVEHGVTHFSGVVEDE